ncbi:hypothetical protein LB505_006695 [Fusarium chuoi]|nr:hypothetical protein LB505_006695 [Fusarium chuoi]
MSWGSYSENDISLIRRDRDHVNQPSWQACFGLLHRLVTLLSSPAHHQLVLRRCIFFGHSFIQHRAMRPAPSLMVLLLVGWVWLCPAQLALMLQVANQGHLVPQVVLTT